MTQRALASIGAAAAALAIVAFMSAPLAGQTAGKKAATGSAISRTPDGKPDLSGMWVNYDQTPFEQPVPGAARANNDGENGPAAGGNGRAAAATGGAAAGGAAAARPRPAAATVSGFTDVPHILAARRPAMVVEPANGRVPVMEWAEKQRDYKVAHIGDTWENGTTWDRCLTRGVPGEIFPTGYNNGYQIVQSPGYVSILAEMIHVTRVIPTDGSPHLPADVRLWDGDSRGHWDGDTLVVDVANYNGKGDIATNMASGRMRGIPASDQLHVIERFTPVSDQTINYEVTINDPKVYTAPWKVAMPLSRDNEYQMFEYACHEGNLYFETNTLSGGRADEKKSAGSKGEGSTR